MWAIMEKGLWRASAIGSIKSLGGRGTLALITFLVEGMTYHQWIQQCWSPGMHQALPQMNE